MEAGTFVLFTKGFYRVYTSLHRYISEHSLKNETKR